MRYDDLSVRFKSFLKPRNAEELLAAATTAKVEDGNIRAAIRLLCSEEKPACDVMATYEKLLERHLEPPIGRGQAKSPDDIAAIQVSNADVLSSIRTFPAGSSGGPDGIRVQHILDLINCLESESALLTSLNAFVNSLLDGKCSPNVTPILSGGQLMA
jgi:hypothetical protein